MSYWKETDFGRIPIDWDVEKVINIKANDKRAIAMGPFGSNIKAENFVSQGVPVIRGTNLNSYKYVAGDFVFLTEEKAEELSGSICKAGDLVFTHRGTIGQVGLIPHGKFEKYIISQSGMKLSVNPNLVSSQFLFYFFSSDYGQYQILKYESQVGVPSISNPLTSLKEIQVPVPSLKEQNAIAEVLSSLDDKIDLLHRQNRTLEQLAETIFRQWFVVESKEEWRRGSLDEEFEFTMGQSPSGDELNESGNGTVFYQGRTDFGFRFPNPRVYTTSPIRLAKPLDTLISVRAPVGDMNMAMHECCLGRGLAAFRFRKDPKFYTYTYYKLRSLMVEIRQFEDNGSVFGSIGKDDFKRIDCIIPPMETILKFQEIAKDLDDKIFVNTNHINTITQLRDTLLLKFISGEVRLK